MDSQRGQLRLCPRPLAADPPPDAAVAVHRGGRVAVAAVRRRSRRRRGGGGGGLFGPLGEGVPAGVLLHQQTGEPLLLLQLRQAPENYFM